MATPQQPIHRSDDLDSWDNLNERTNGKYDRLLHALAAEFSEKKMTLRELQVCILVSEHKSSAAIADILIVNELSINRYRSRAKHKIGLNSEESLTEFLLAWRGRIEQ